MHDAALLMVRYVAIRRDLPRHPFEGGWALWLAFRRAFWALMAPVVLFAAKVANVPFERMAHALLPWLVPLFTVLGLITRWPALTTFLPGLLLGR